MPIKPDLTGVRVWPKGQRPDRIGDPEDRKPTRGEQQRQALEAWNRGHSRRKMRYMVSLSPPVAEWIRNKCGHGQLSRGIEAIAKLAQASGVEHLNSASKGEDVQALQIKLAQLEEKFSDVLDQLLHGRKPKREKYLPRKGERNTRIRVNFGEDSSGKDPDEELSDEG